MFLNPQEMTALCVFHAGTVSATLEALKGISNQPPERMAVIAKLIDVLSGMKDGDVVSLAFEPEK